MSSDPLSTLRPQGASLLLLCIAGSVTAHGLLLTLLPGWIARRDTPPPPLTVELQPEPPPIAPPQPLPMEARPQRPAQEIAKPVATPVAQPRREPILTAPPEAPPSPVAIVVPEQRPAPPLEAPRAPPLAATPAPVTPPRSDAAYLNNPRPVYPPTARRRGDQGTVLIRVVVTVEGLAASVGLEKSSGHPSLDDAALVAVKSWRFVPARQGGQAVESPYVVPIVFKLD